MGTAIARLNLPKGTVGFPTVQQLCWCFNCRQQPSKLISAAVAAAQQAAAHVVARLAAAVPAKGAKQRLCRSAGVCGLRI